MAASKPHQEIPQIAETEQTCFVIMPISDGGAPYDSGHWLRVYNHLIKPACELAGYKPIRADDVKHTNFIVLDIVRRIVEAPIAICDLSSRNPNVFYELGIRQAFNLPVVFIKDDTTERVFDIQGFRDVEYPTSLRIDGVAAKIPDIANALTETAKGKDINSLISLLGIKAAVAEGKEVSSETALILKSLEEIGSRVTRIERHSSPSISDMEMNEMARFLRRNRNSRAHHVPGGFYTVGSYVYNPTFGSGIVRGLSENGKNAEVEFGRGQTSVVSLTDLSIVNDKSEGSTSEATA